LRKRVTFEEISPSEFFYRNRDLAGFTNPARALYSSVRELVENSLDACDLAEVHPKIYVRLMTANGKEVSDKPQEFAITVKDNGMGIEGDRIPLALGKVFFGSKFKLRQTRGMFGMGGTMSILYGQITTHRPVRIISSTDGKTLHDYELLIDIEKNKPIILKHEKRDAGGWRGTSITLHLYGDYFRSSGKIMEYFKKTALVTPYADIVYFDPYGRLLTFKRGTDEMPEPPKEVDPHPKGIDVEGLRRMIRVWEDGDMLKFFCRNFHRVGRKIALNFLNYAKIDPNRDPRTLSNEEIVRLASALRSYDGFLPPDAKCLSPLGERILTAGIIKELDPEFYTVSIRGPSAYGGYPFIVEIGLAYGGKVERKLKLFRFANRIPLLYDEGSDVSWKVLNEGIDWKHYKLSPDLPLTIITHICSTKIPYKTVGKEYIADRPEIEREIRNGIKEVLRKLSSYLSRKGIVEAARRKQNIYARYLPLISKFATELAERRKRPDITRLVGERP
jgi:DNA topoisomerase-6 subunit B